MATYAGNVLMASFTKDHVINTIRAGRCNKANQAKVTDVKEFGVTIETAVTEALAPPSGQDKFDINERFDFLSDFVFMVADRTSPSLVVSGEGGLGKTHTVLKAAAAAGLKDARDVIGAKMDGDFEEGEDPDSDEGESKTYISPSEARKLYTMVKGYSTAKGLYRTLYENRNRIIIFDDADVFKDPVAANLLKGALDSYERRIISWNAEPLGETDLPRSFEFRGGVIFITNIPLYKLDSAVKSRAICVDLSMNADQKIERMGAIIKSHDFLPDYDLKVKKEALKFLEQHKHVATSLNLRTLIQVTKVAARGENWERRAEYLLTAI
jgi:hypothetical protein